MSSLLKPTSRMNVRGVGIDPEVTALRIPIKVQAQAVATHLSHSEDEVHGWVLRVNAFQLHAQFEAILVVGDCLRILEEADWGSDSLLLLQVGLPGPAFLLLTRPQLASALFTLWRAGGGLSFCIFSFFLLHGF